MNDENPSPPDDATIIAAKQDPPQREAEASVPSDATVWAHSDATELARRPAPPADDPAIEAPPDPFRRETPAREGTLLERHLGPPPASAAVARTDRAGMPSLLRRDRRYRRFTLLGLGVSIVVCLAGWWVLWQLW